MKSQQIDYEKLAARLLKQAATKAVSATPTGVFGHGPGGIFSFPGLEPGVVNAMVLPSLGLMSVLPSRTSRDENPMYALMTGVTASVGSEPAGPCDDPPYSGVMKLCMHTFLWGRQSRRSKVWDLTEMGKVRNRSDFLDLTLYGDPLAASPNPMVPGTPGDPSQALRSEIQKQLFEFSVSWARDFAPVLFTGDPLNNTANGGYREPYGLETLINTGYRDAESGVACPAADSIVYDFNDAQVDENVALFIRLVSDIFTRLRFNADKMGLAPAEWAFVGPRSLFQVITEFWPCAYHSYRCQMLGTNTEGVVDLGRMNEMRDQMREGSYLLVDGRAIPYIIDDSIPETETEGSCQIADLYIVPLRYLGARPALFLEYFDFDGPGAAMEAAKVFAPDGTFFTTNGGRYLWVKKPPTNYCVEFQAVTKWRAILETPQLAARILDIKYCPFAHERSWDPDNSYYVDGGGTNRTAFDKSFFTPTA